MKQKIPHKKKSRSLSLSIVAIPKSDPSASRKMRKSFSNISQLHRSRSFGSSHSSSTFSNNYRRCSLQEGIGSAGLPEEDLNDSDDHKNVRFDKVKIREFPITIGDNVPSRGPPITIAWNHVSSVSLPLNQYESSRENSRRETQEELKVPLHRREQMLRRLGFSRKEIQQGTKVANISRGKRRKTKSQLRSSSFHEKLETIRDHMQNALTLGRKKRQEKSYLKKYAQSP